MTDAPERIWLDDERRVGGSATVLLTEPVYDDPFVHEYLRADLAKPKVKPLVWVRDKERAGHWKAETAIGVVRCVESQIEKFEEKHKRRILEQLE